MSKKTTSSSQRRLQKSLLLLRRRILASKLKKISSPAYDTKKDLSILELSCYIEKPQSLLNSSLTKITD